MALRYEMNKLNIEKIAWEKVDNLLPVIIQDHLTLQVLMLGYMNKEAFEKSFASGYVYFYSRTKKRLWMKGETSGNQLRIIDAGLDCDNDTLLIQADINAQVCCHRKQVSCFDTKKFPPLGLLSEIEGLITARFHTQPDGSYITKLFKQGDERIAQKVGEEGLEVALAAVLKRKDEIINESADLLFHLLILLRKFDLQFADVLDELQKRRRGDSVV